VLGSVQGAPETLRYDQSGLLPKVCVARRVSSTRQVHRLFSNNVSECTLGSHLVIMEVKANTLSVRAKYGFDADRLELELQRKTISGYNGNLHWMTIFRFRGYRGYFQ
jgi:hypothetical protein